MINHAALYALAQKSAMRWCLIILTVVSVSFGVLQPSKVMAQNAVDPAQSSTGSGEQLQTALSQASGARPVELKAEDRAILQQFGAFTQHVKYGEVWAPSATPENWHPFMACNWVNTKQFGWYYDDKTPWGNIVHHYGRWTHDPQSGWIWIPGMEFSPGWVVWRTSPQWIGWAPTPPDQDVETMQSDAFNNGGFWTFMETPHFNSGCKGGVAPQAQIPVLLKKTQYVTNFELRGGIGIFVLPTYIYGPFVEIFINVQPWPDLFYEHMLLVWTFIWNQLDVVTIEITVPCNQPPPSPPQPPCTDGRIPDGHGHCITGPQNIRKNPQSSPLPRQPALPVVPPPTTSPPVYTPPPGSPCNSPAYLDGAGRCVYPCPSGTHRENGTCVTDKPPCSPPKYIDGSGNCVIPCPQGMHPQYGTCVNDNPLPPPDPQCYSPKQLDAAGNCVDPSPCPPGTHPGYKGHGRRGKHGSKMICVPDSVPPTNYPPCNYPSHLDAAGNCVRPCPDGMHAWNGTCMPNTGTQGDSQPRCPDGMHASNGTCLPNTGTQGGSQPRCPDGMHPSNGTCLPNSGKTSEVVPPIVCKGSTHLLNGACVPNLSLPGSKPSDTGLQRCPNGTYVSMGHSCEPLGGKKEKIPPSITSQPDKPRPLVSPDWRQKPTGPATSGSGGYRPQTKTCSNGTRVPLYSRCPVYRQPGTASDAPSGGYPISRPKAPVNDGPTSARPRPIKWPTQTRPLAPRPNYQNLYQRPATSSGQSGGVTNRSGNWGSHKFMRTHPSEGGLFD